jgi:hypothetical protein
MIFQYPKFCLPSVQRPVAFRRRPVRLAQSRPRPSALGFFNRLRFQYVVLSRSARGFASAASSRHCFAKASHGSRQDAFAVLAASRSHSSARRKARSCLSFILLQRSEDDFVSGGRLSGPFRSREGAPDAQPRAQGPAKLLRLPTANCGALLTSCEQFAGTRPHTACRSGRLSSGPFRWFPKEPGP